MPKAGERVTILPALRNESGTSAAWRGRGREAHLLEAPCRRVWGPCTPELVDWAGLTVVVRAPGSLANLKPDLQRVPASAQPWPCWNPSLGSRPALSPTAQPSLTASPQTEEFFDLIASSQSRRLDDQRASVGSLPGLRITHNNLGHLRGDGDPQEPGDEFFNMLIKCQVGLRPGRRVCVPQARLRPAVAQGPFASCCGGFQQSAGSCGPSMSEWVWGMPPEQRNNRLAQSVSPSAQGWSAFLTWGPTPPPSEGSAVPGSARAQSRRVTRFPRPWAQGPLQPCSSGKKTKVQSSTPQVGRGGRVSLSPWGLAGRTADTVQGRESFGECLAGVEAAESAHLTFVSTEERKARPWASPRSLKAGPLKLPKTPPSPPSTRTQASAAAPAPSPSAPDPAEDPRRLLVALGLPASAPPPDRGPWGAAHLRL